MKTDIGNILFHLLEIFVRKQLIIVITATPVILSIELPHAYKKHKDSIVVKRYFHILWHSSWMAYKSLFICLLLTSVNFGVNAVIVILIQICFKICYLSPETCLDFHSGSYYIPYKNPTEI